MLFGGDRQLFIYLGIGLGAGVLLTVLFIRTYLDRRSQTTLSKAKDEFVALASHYLLTPISIIQGTITRLQEQDSTLNVDERQKLYTDISKGQQRLWILAEQLVLVSQVEGRMLKLKIETNSVITVVQSALEAVDIFARAKNIKLQLADQTGPVQEARFDTRRMRQAVIAILDNAIKFSPEGTTIVAQVTQEPQSFAIHVTDQGPGMSGKAIDTATQRFSRGTSSYTFDHEGIGLGLYTANAILREHGGELRFDTSSRRGTTVTLRFPNQ